MKRVILGTAGHIDHGKTQLIRALTGTDTDRLKEEKERGISIELGFANLDVGDDIRIGIIDVPGHEKFVRQMVAGSGGVDIAALVVALDEGVMPQTVEHLDILSLLHVQRGLVVLTKLDLVDEELAMLAEEDAREVVKGTFLEDSPMVRVSAKTGQGMDELLGVLKQLTEQVTDRPVHGLLRLPVDRVFTLKGHGTVVTGTLISGSISIGDEIEILPSERRSSVRSLQSHSTQEEHALPGERVAVNLRGLEASDVQRGEVITHPGEIPSSYILDCRLRVLARSPMSVKNRQKVRLHHYTTEVEARVILPQGEELEPGQESMVQLRAASPIVPSSGDRFVIRAMSPVVTLGGGVILNPRGAKLRARSVKSFMEIETAERDEIVDTVIRSAGLVGCTRNELLGMSGLSAKRLDSILEKLRNSRTAIRFDPAEDRYVHAYFVDVMKKKLLDKLKAFHTAQPLKEGIPKQELRSSIAGPDKLFRKLMESLTADGQVVDQGGTVRSVSHKVSLKDEEQGLKDTLFKLIVNGGSAPPTFKELIAQCGSDQKQVRSMLDLLTKDEKIVKVKEDLYFSTKSIEETKKKLADFIKKEGGITPSQFSGVTGSSRKFNIPLLEYFDRERFTIRVGDQRVLRGSDT
jgi:selenocysteine-specific elongation factor